MQTKSLAIVGSCGRFPRISIPKSLRTPPPNKCPMSVLKIARVDSSFARYTFTFCVTLLNPANFDCDARLSVVVSFWYDSIHSFQKFSF